MREILERAQQDIDNKFFEKERQDRMLAPDEIPWTVQYNSLILRAQQGGWSWKLLNYTIIGVRECAYKKGIFEEIFVNSVQDPRALDPSGGRFLNIVERSRPSPPPANGVVAPRPLPPGLRRCEDFTTEIRLLFEFADAVDAYAMQEIYDQAQKALLNIIQTQGDRVLVGGDLPWTFQGNGLLLKAQFEGWSFGALNRTIGAMRKCTFQPGTFREVLVYDIAGENLPPGQRYMDLRKSQRLS